MFISSTENSDRDRCIQPYFFNGMIRWNLFPVNAIPVFNALLN